MYNSVPTGSAAVRRSTLLLRIICVYHIPAFKNLQYCHFVFLLIFIINIFSIRGQRDLFFNCSLIRPTLPFLSTFVAEVGNSPAEILHVFVCLPFVWCGMINVFSYAIFWICFHLLRGRSRSSFVNEKYPDIFGAFGTLSQPLIF